MRIHYLLTPINSFFLQNIVRHSNRLMRPGLQQNKLFDETLSRRDDLEPFLKSLGGPKRPRPDVCFSCNLYFSTNLKGVVYFNLEFN